MNSDLPYNLFQYSFCKMKLEFLFHSCCCMAKPIQYCKVKYKIKIYFLKNKQLRSRDITLSTKVRFIKAMVFPVVMYGCDSWTIKKAEHWRINAFELWCWRRLLRVPWTARRSNQSILKEISLGCSLEVLMFKLKL